MKEMSINFDILSHLDDIGLINFDSMAGFALLDMPENFRVVYHDCPVDIKMPLGKKDFEIGAAILTYSGKQLAPIAGSKPSLNYFEYILSEWVKRNYVASIPIEGREAWHRLYSSAEN